MEKLAYIEMKIEKGERTYRFLMPVGAPVGEAFDSLNDFLKEIINFVKQMEPREEKKGEENEQ